MNSDIVIRIRQVLSALSPEAVYLFGSAAAGRARPDSDLDLAILPTHPVPPSQLLEVRLRLEETLGCDVDLIDLARSSTVLLKEVLAGGRLLYESSSARREEFEMYALSDYARLNEERAPVLAALRQPLPTNA